MSADPDDSFTLDMIVPAAARDETSKAEKAKAKIARRHFKARLLGFMAPSAEPRAWRREPVLISPRRPRRAAAAARLR